MPAKDTSVDIETKKSCGVTFRNRRICNRQNHNNTKKKTPLLPHLFSWLENLFKVHFFCNICFSHESENWTKYAEVV